MRAPLLFAREELISVERGGGETLLHTGLCSKFLYLCWYLDDIYGMDKICKTWNGIPMSLNER